MPYTLTLQDQIASLTYQYRCLRDSPSHSEQLAEVRRKLAALEQPVDPLLEPGSPQLPKYRELYRRTFTIVWSGPFTLDDTAVLRTSWGLYFFRGQCKQQHYSRLQYCGITEQYYSERFSNHYQLSLIRRDLEIWLGQIVSPQGMSRKQMIQAEHMIIHALQSPLNRQRRNTEPQPTTIISHWYNRYGQRQPYPYADFPTVMAWDGEVWQKGDLQVWS
jgi:hypothetical protein